MWLLFAYFNKINKKGILYNRKTIENNQQIYYYIYYSQEEKDEDETI